ncbi:MAG: S8 family serine peptidase [Candidatus Aenigmarchaeota archaeon]|nr:S8 family serine peptidase [Candidatus Aenigmarchaeota archaeon]
MKKILIITIIAFVLLAEPALQLEDNSELKEPIILESREITEALPFDIETGNHYIVQFNFIPSNEEKLEMEASGLLLIDYIPEKTWIAKVSDELTLENPNITYVGEILPEDKLSPGIKPNPDSQKLKKLKVILFADGGKETIEEYGTVVSENSNSFVVQITENLIKRLASEDDVKWIEEIRIPILLNDGARSTCGVNTVQANPYNLTGAGVALAMWDGGLANHSDYNARRVIGNNVAENYHATHVAGIMVSNGSLSQSKGGTAFQWKGMSPNATVVSYYFWPQASTYTEINESITSYGAVLSQNSWGWNVHNCSELGDYDSDSQEYDKIVRGTTTPKPMTVVFSAGNERATTTDSFGLYYCGAASQGSHTYNTSLGPGATAKNTITVGAVDDSENMASFSSWGPTDDGRIKPDVVAVGVNIKSTYIGETYTELDGTSMAAPVVSGIIGLMVESYRNTHNNANITPSTVKAILIHTAKDLDNTGPDFKMGWGLVNATAAINKIIDDKNYSGIIKNGSLSDGTNNTYTILVSENNSQIKLTLVWSDYQGTLSAPKKLINNLDLWIENSTGDRFYPWILNLSNLTQPATTGNDSINNIEQIIINNASSGNYTVIVNGTSMPQAPQEYSLIFNDLGNPLWSDNKTSPNSSGLYTENQSYQFNITWSDSFTIDVVIFEFNGTNYTAENRTGNEYYYNMFNLTLGNYSYKWYANDTSGNVNSTDSWTYAINEPDISIILISPENNSFTNNQTVLFSFNATRAIDSALNCSLYINNTLNQTNDTVSLNIETVFSLNISESIYEWHINCSNDTVTNISGTNIVTIDTTAPRITIDSPSDDVYNALLLDLNYSVNESYLDSCWYEYNGTSTSLENCSNSSFSSLDDQVSVVTIYANDSAGNINSSNISFSVYTPDLLYNITINNFSDTEFNVTINITNLNISQFNFSIPTPDYIIGFNVTDNSTELNVTGNSSLKVINTTSFSQAIVSYSVNVTQINQSNTSYSLGRNAFDLDYGLIIGKSSFFYPSNRSINFSTSMVFSVPENWTIAIPLNHTNSTYSIYSNKGLESIIAIGNLTVSSTLVNGTNITVAYPSNANRTYHNNTYYYENNAGELPDFSNSSYADNFYSVYVDIFNESLNSKLLVFYPLFIGSDLNGDSNGYSVYATPYDIEHSTSHQIFHLWNSDIFIANSSSEQWFAEGVTEYYSCLARYNSSLYNRKQYYICLSDWYDTFNNATGTNSSLNVSLIDAGNSDSGGVVGEANYKTIYYSKGAVLTYLWNKNITSNTTNKSFNDVMLYLYQNFYNSRYNNTDIINAVNNITGGNFTWFFNNFVNGTDNFTEANDDFSDTDSDGLVKILETELGTSPTTADTDGDGTDDGAEYDAGSNPLAAPATPNVGGGSAGGTVGSSAAAPVIEVICTESELKCDESLYICSNNSWQVSEDCEYGCENKACKEKPKICTEDELRCSGVSLEKCLDEYEWSLVETCDYKCENNACIEEPKEELSSPVGAFFGMGTETIAGLATVIAIVIITILVIILKKKKNNNSVIYTSKNK